MFFKLLDDELVTLQQHAVLLLRSGLRPNTMKTYDAAQKRYLEFCARYTLCALPASEDTMLLYVAYLHKEDLKASSVKVYIAAVRALHIEVGYGNPMEGYLRMQRAIRALEINSEPPMQKLPITIQIMSQLYGVVGNDYNSKVTWAAMALGNFGCLRAAEFCVTQRTFNPRVNLTMSDITINATQGITDSHACFRIKRSKTDKSNKGFQLYIACTGENVCGYCAVIQMLRARQAAGLPMDDAMPLFMYSNGAALTRTQFVVQTRLHLAMLGYDTSNYSGHSYRAGSATTAAANGLPDWQIKLLERCNSDAYHRYIRTSVQTVLQFSKLLCKN